MSNRPVNFAPGPSILDLSVLEQASKDVVALDGLGLSILEISHRSPTFERILNDARDGLRQLMAVPDTHDILFLQGGARGQFAQVPMNFLRPGQTAAYVDTGAWSKYALAEAQVLGQATAAASSQADGYTHLPDVSRLRFDEDTAYVHTTSNNTIYGTQWQELPDFGPTPHVCDMSSDILSRPVNVSRFHGIYAGAQKNAGPAGVTLAILDKAWMEAGRVDIPSIYRYAVQAKKGSTYNTPPVFAIYVVGLVVKWLQGLGGVDAIHARNERKARLLYEAIDGSGGFYAGTVTDPGHRSHMNVTWRLPSEELERRFVAEAAEAGLVSLKGHHSVGGVRASIYNALPVEGVERLVSFMGDFRAKHG